MKFSRILQACLLTASLTGAHAHASLLQDGDFEKFGSLITSGDYETIFNGQLGAYWTVGASSIDLIRNQYGTINGTSVDLSGTPGPGWLQQSFLAEAGKTYELSFDYFRNGAGTDMLVSFGGVDHLFATVNSVTGGKLLWTATVSGEQFVRFGGGDGNNGPTLDNVSLNAVPEPTSIALFAAALAGLGFASRRRNKKA